MQRNEEEIDKETLRNNLRKRGAGNTPARYTGSFSLEGTKNKGNLS
jgi:hypothetical protein